MASSEASAAPSSSERSLRYFNLKELRYGEPPSPQQVVMEPGHVAYVRAHVQSHTCISQVYEFFFGTHPPAHGKYLKYPTLSIAISHPRQLLSKANLRMSFFHQHEYFIPSMTCSSSHF
jgi:hypothetical protein